MKGTKTKLIISILVITILVFSVVSASMLIPRSDKAKPNEEAPITPPGLDKVVFIHYKKGYGGFCNFNGECERDLGENPSCADCKKDKEEPEDPDTSSCYAFLARGVKWKELPVDYVINPINPDGLSEEFVTNTISISAETWDDATSIELFDDAYTIDINAQYGIQNFENVIAFGDYPQDGVIAVAIVWGYFGGRPSSRKIVEFDILFDTDFTWGDASEDLSLMDLQNIATHELGHGVGLGDLYNTECAEETMYGYSNYGETKKRSLELGDITGINQFY